MEGEDGGGRGPDRLRRSWRRARDRRWCRRHPRGLATRRSTKSRQAGSQGPPDRRGRAQLQMERLRPRNRQKGRACHRQAQPHHIRNAGSCPLPEPAPHGAPPLWLGGRRQAPVCAHQGVWTAHCDSVLPGMMGLLSMESRRVGSSPVPVSGPVVPASLAPRRFRSLHLPR